MAVSLKSCVVGDGAVGKTSLLVRFTQDMFEVGYQPTVSDTYAKSFTFEGRPVSLRLMDTPGQDDYEKMRPLMYQGTDVYVLCFSVESRTSMENVSSKWIHEIEQNKLPEAKIILVGTKTDLRKLKLTEGTVSPQEGEQLKKDIKACKYLECSSQTGEGVNDVFEEIARVVLHPQRKPKNPKKPCTII